jgi:type II secretory pathway component GspD/PulD (secretin)
VGRTGADGVNQAVSDMREDDADTPPEERTYLISLENGTYSDLTKSFARQAGLPIIGENPPDTKKISYVSTKEMDYETALNEVRRMLFHADPLTPYTIKRDENYFEVGKVIEEERKLPLDRIFTSREAFENADLDDYELAMLLYTPPEGAAADLELVLQFTPDYFRIGPLPDVTKNALKIFAPAIHINKYFDIVEIITTGVGDDPRELVIIRVHHIVASDALEILRELIEDLNEGEGAGTSPRVRRATTRAQKADDPLASAEPPPAIIYANDAHDELIVRAMPSTIADIREMLPLVDRADPDPPTPVIIKLKYAQAGELVDFLKPMLGVEDGVGTSATALSRRRVRARKKQAGSESVKADGIVLISDPNQNALIVLAGEEDVELVRKLVDMFDTDHGDTDNVERVELCCSDPNVVMTTLNTAYREQTKGQNVEFNVLADPGGGAVIMVGPTLYRDRAKNLLAEIDIASDPVGLHRARLENAVPTALVSLLQNYDKALQSGSAESATATRRPSRRRRSAAQLGGVSDKFIGSDETKMLYVICSDVEWEDTYKPLIHQIDAEAKLDEDAPVVIHLENAEPAAVMEVLNQAFPQAAVRGKGAADKSLRFAVSSSGIIVIDATEGELANIRQLIEQELDISPGDSDQRLFRLEHAPAAEVEKAIQQVVLGDANRPRSRRGRRGASTGDDSRVATVGETIIVTGPVEVLDEVSQLIEDLDVPEEEEPFATRIFKFAVGTDINQVFTSLEQIHGSQVKRRSVTRAGGGEAGTAKFVPLVLSNQVLVHAPESEMPAIESTVSMLQNDPENPTQQIRFFEVENGDVGVMKDLIQPLLQMRVGELVLSGEIPSRGEPIRGAKAASVGPEVTVHADAALSRLIVAAPASVMDEAASLITEFDKANDCEQVIRTVSLSKASAEETKAVIEGMVKGEAAAAVSSPSEEKTPRFRRDRARRSTSRRITPSTTASAGDPDSPVNVYLAPGGGSLVLAGCVEDVEKAESWIAMLDVEAEKNESIEVYTLLNSDTEDLANIVLSIVDSAPPAPATESNSSLDEDDPLGFGDFFDFGPTGPQTHKGADLVIITEPITRKMIVKGSPSKLREAREVISYFEPLDGSDPVFDSAPPTPFLVYQLDNRTDPYEAMFQLEEVMGKLWPYQETPRIEDFDIDNSLIIRGKPEHFPEVVELIKKYVDKESKQTLSRKTKSFLVKKGLPSDMAQRLIADLESQGYEIEFTEDADAIRARENIKMLDPLAEPKEIKVGDQETEETEETEEAEETEGDVAPCVLPMSLRALMGVHGSMWSQADDPDPPADEDEALPTPAQLILQKLALEAAEQAEGAGEDSDSEAASDDESDDESEEKSKGKISIDVSDIDKLLRVKGSQKALEAIEELVEELQDELEEIPDQFDIRVFQLKFIDVTTAEEILESMFGAAKSSGAAQVNQQSRAQQLQMMRAMMAASGRGGNQPNQGGDQQNPNQQQQEQQAAVQQEPINIRTYARPRDRQLIVRAKPEDFPVIIELLATIDREAEVEVDFEIFPLVRLNAIVVADQLKELLGLDESGASPVPRQPTAPQRRLQRGRPNQPQPQVPIAPQSPGGDSWAINPSDQIVITADEANNSILAMAPKAGLELIGKWIKQLEEQSGLQTEARTYRLEHADASEIVPELTKLLEGTIAPSGKEGDGFNPVDMNKPKLMAIPRTNSIVVRALAQDFPKIEPLINDLDRDLGDEGYKVEVYPVPGGNVTKLAAALTSIYVDSGSVGPRGAGATSSKVKIVGDDSSNTIIVHAPDALRKEIAGRIDEMLGTQDNIVKETIPLMLAKPSQVAAALKETLGGPRGQLGGEVAIAGDDNSKQLVVMAPRKTFEEIKSLAKKLDLPPTGLDVRIFSLEHAKAAEVADIITKMATTYFQSKRGGAAVDPPSVTPDAATNSLIIMGESLMFDRLGSLIEEIDVEGAAGPGVNLIMVEHVEANGLATSLSQMYQGRGSGRPGENPVAISNPQGTSALIVRADPKDLEDIQAVVADLDRPERLGGEAIEAVQVRYSTATEMKAVLTEHLRQAGQTGGGRGGEKLRNDVRLGVSESTNTIMISGDQEEVGRLVALTKRLDESQESGGQGTQIITVQHVRPSDIEPTLQKMYGEGRQGGRRSGSDLVPSIVADDAAKVLLVRASAMDLAGIESLVVRLDRADAPPREGIRVVSVDDGVNVFEMAQIVQEAMTKSLGASGNLESVLSVQADDNSNSIILAGAADKFDSAEQLIRQLQEMGNQAGGERTLIIDLKNIGSAEVKEMIEQMTEDSAGSGSNNRRNIRPGGNRGGDRQRFNQQRGGRRNR